MFFIIFKHFNTKYNLNKIKFNDESNIKKLLNYFTFTDNNKCIDYFKKLFNCTHITNNIYIKNETILYINFKTQLNEFDFHTANNYFHEHKLKTVIFISNTQDDTFQILLNNSPNKYHCFNINQIYQIIKDKQIFPIDFSNTTLKNKKIYYLKIKIASNLTQKYFFRFLFSGLSLILISFFIPFSIYYLFFGTILIILSIICLFNKNKTLINQKESLASLIDK